MHVCALPSLIPRLLPSFLLHTVCDKKLGRSLETRLGITYSRVCSCSSHIHSKVLSPPQEFRKQLGTLGFLGITAPGMDEFRRLQACSTVTVEGEGLAACSISYNGGEGLVACSISYGGGEGLVACCIVVTMEGRGW